MLINMSISKIQTGDNVRVISGNYKGTNGVVTQIKKTKLRSGKVQLRAAVSGVPKIAKFRKSQTYQDQKYPGSRLEVDRFIHISNISLVTSEGNLSKVKIDLQGGKKLRTYKKNNATVVKQKVDKSKAKEAIEEK
jgi:large subunit ribosomal protein L24